MVVEETLSKHLYKTILILLKTLPFILAAVYLLYTILAFIGIDAIFFGYICHISLLPWVFIYTASFAFNFCIVHRLPLYYILVNDTLTTLDYYLNIPVNNFTLLMLHSIIAGVFIFLILLYHQKYVRHNKETTYRNIREH